MSPVFPPPAQQTWPFASPYNSTATGPMRESIPRYLINSTAVTGGTTGTSSCVNIWAQAGDIVTGIYCKFGAQAAVGPTNWWLALYDTAATPALIGQTADQLTAAIVANSGTATAGGTSGTGGIPLTGGPFTLAATGLYTAVFNATAGTMPNFGGFALNTNSVSGGLITNQKRLFYQNPNAAGSAGVAAPTITGSLTTLAAGIPYVVLT